MNNDRLRCRVLIKETSKYIPKVLCVTTLAHKGIVSVFRKDHHKIIRSDYVRSSVIIEQCTGRKDANGELLFEGDKLVNSRSIYTVKYSNEHGFYAESKRGSKLWNQVFCYCTIIKEEGIIQ